MSKTKCSPPLVMARTFYRKTRVLRVRRNGTRFASIDLLETMVEVPDSSAYWIEVARDQWPDASGCAVWVCWHAYGQVKWSWGRRPIATKSSCGVPWFPIDKALDALGLPLDRPVKLYFRLIYLEK